MTNIFIATHSQNCCFANTRCRQRKRRRIMWMPERRRIMQMKKERRIMWMKKGEEEDHVDGEGEEEDHVDARLMTAMPT